MKNIIIAIIAVLAVAAIVSASSMSKDDALLAIQGFAGNESKDVTATGNSQTIDITSDIAWQALSTNGGVYRTMSSATKTGIAHTLPAGAWQCEVVNKIASKNRFLNLSGANDIRRQ